MQTSCWDIDITESTIGSVISDWNKHSTSIFILQKKQKIA
jgi:hypothetical protein